MIRPNVTWLSFVVIHLITVGSTVRAQHIIEVPQNRSAFTSVEAEKWLGEVMPLVERFAEKRFKQPPRLKLIDREQLIALRKRDWKATQSGDGHAPTEGDGPYGDPAHYAAWMYSTVAAYHRADATLYAIPTNVNLIRLPRGGPRSRAALVKCILAHELVHALQNQDGLPDAFVKTPDSWEEALARLAFAEGQAEFIEQRVGLELGFDTTRMDTEDEAPPPAIESLLKLPNDFPLRGAAFYRRWIYQPGRNFVFEHWARGGMSRVWKMFQAPPSDMGMILHPQDYSPQKRNLRDCSGALDAIVDSLGKPRWKKMSLKVGPWWLEAHQPEMALLNAEEKAALEQHVVVCNVCLAKDPKDFGFLHCTIYELKDAASAPAVLAIAEAARQRPRDDKDAEGKREPFWAVFPFASAAQGRYLVTFSGHSGGLKRAALESALRQALAKLNGEPAAGQTAGSLSDPVIRLPDLLPP